MHPTRRLLRSLTDIQGVIGSFLLAEGGSLVATDVPPTFDIAGLAEAGPRIARLADLGGTYGEETQFLVLRFAEYKLYVRVLRTLLLGVLVTPAASMPVLKAAAAVVARRAEAMLAAEANAGPDTTREAPHFDFERAPPADAAPNSVKRPSAPPPGAALSASPALTTTLPSLTAADLGGSSQGVPAKRSIPLPGRSR